MEPEVEPLKGGGVSPIPIVGGLIQFFAEIVISSIGLANAHETSGVKSTFSVLFGLVLFFILVVGIVFVGLHILGFFISMLIPRG